jgi:hypothetical protein
MSNDVLAAHPMCSNVESCAILEGQQHCTGNTYENSDQVQLPASLLVRPTLLCGVTE